MVRDADDSRGINCVRALIFRRCLRSFETNDFRFNEMASQKSLNRDDNGNVSHSYRDKDQMLR